MSDVIKFPGPSAPHNPPQKEARAVADLDDGFTRVANELLDALMRTKMSGTQSQVVMAVILHIMVQLLIILLMPLIYGPTVLPRPQTGQVSITTGLT